MIDRKFRMPRIWSNQELKKIAPLFHGEIVNVSAWDDRDKQGGRYKKYFKNAKNYFYTNLPGERGLQKMSNEYEVDLTQDIPAELIKKFDVALNHTTLEHIFDVRKAFNNICKMSKDVVIIIVPFAQMQHETGSWKDYWRFTPTCLRELFKENNMEVVYESESPQRNAGIYLISIGSRNPSKWKNKLPIHEKVNEAGRWIGHSIAYQFYKATINFLVTARNKIKNNA